MEKVTFKTPMVYGDHHVTEVRQLLFALPGVKEVYASSAFQMVEVDYDPVSISAEKIQEVLETAGYLGELAVPEETGTTAYLEEEQPIFIRHTEAYSGTKETVSFAQKLPFSGRPLWPCPGIGTLETSEKDIEKV